MSTYTEYLEFCEEESQSTSDDFFERLAIKFGVDIGTAYSIWYAEQRSWFKGEMIDELIRLDKVTGEFKPNLYTGEFDWDAVNKKFVPEGK